MNRLPMKPRHASILKIACAFLVHAALLSPTVLLAQTPLVSFANDPASEPREHPVDIVHMRVEVSFEPEKGLVKGRVTHIFHPLRSRVDSIFFDGPGIRIRSAHLNGRPVPYTLSPGGVTVRPDPQLRWGSTDSVQFVYEANPRRGIYFVGWNDPKNLSRKQIWTQGQGIDNRHWIPCYDEMNDKLTTETIVTFDRKYRVLSNGVKRSERDNGDGTKTWHYAMTRPHTTYLVMLGIGEYEVKTLTSSRGVPVHLWYYPEFPDRVEPTYRYSAEMVDFIEEETAVPYPWESYSQIPVQDFLYGAMENTTATVFGDFFLVDARANLDRPYINVNVHELAHQWFGDYVTARSSKHAWLQESFATFYSKMFARKIAGEDQLQWMRRGEHNAALAASDADRFPIVHSRAGGARIYQKGSAVIEMMMYTFGEKETKAAITHFLKRHAYSNAETSDLYHSFQDTLGLVPDWFFEQWLYRGGEPHYEVRYQDITHAVSRERRTEVTISQVHPTYELVKLFKMPIEIQVHYRDGSYDARRLMVERASQTVAIPNPRNRQIAFVLFDPGSNILKKVTFHKSFEELRLQALGAPNMIDRYDALVGMREIDLQTKREVLIEVFGKNRFPAIRAEAVSQLARDSDPKSKALMRRAIADPAAEVRLSVITNVDRVEEAERSGFERLLSDSSYEVVRTALEKLTRWYPQQRGRYLDITKNDYGIGNEVKVKWHEINASAGDRSSLASLIEYAGRSYEFRTRVNALNALKRLNYLDGTVVGHLVDAMLHPNNRLRGPAMSVTEYFVEQSAYAKLFSEYYASRSWEPWQRELLERFVR